MQKFLSWYYLMSHECTSNHVGVRTENDISGKKKNTELLRHYKTNCPSQ